MISPALPYTIAPEIFARLQGGTAELFGAVIKEKATGRILAHVQPTQVSERFLAHGSSLIHGVGQSGNPLSFATGLVGAIQNEQIKSRLDRITGGLEVLQATQLLNLAVSVVGVGVTVASTALILNRIGTLDSRLADVSAKVDAIVRHVQIAPVRNALSQLRASAEAAATLETRTRDVSPHLERIENDLRKCYEDFRGSYEALALSHSVQVSDLEGILSALATSGGLQVRLLLWSEELKTAEATAKTQFDHLAELSWALPADKLEAVHGPAAAAPLIAALSGLRTTAATRPDLMRAISDRGIGGRAYVTAATTEREHPLLFLAASG